MATCECEPHSGSTDTALQFRVRQRNSDGHDKTASTVKTLPTNAATASRNATLWEVKEKDSDGFGDPLEMVDEEKQRRLTRAVEAWLARHPEAGGLTVSFDVVAVRGRRLERISEAF
jgi:hypothetical protein